MMRIHLNITVIIVAILPFALMLLLLGDYFRENIRYHLDRGGVIVKFNFHSTSDGSNRLSKINAKLRTRIAIECDSAGVRYNEQLECEKRVTESFNKQNKAYK